MRYRTLGLKKWPCLLHFRLLGFTYHPSSLSSSLALIVNSTIVMRSRFVTAASHQVVYDKFIYSDPSHKPLPSPFQNGFDQRFASLQSAGHLYGDLYGEKKHRGRKHRSEGSRHRLTPYEVSNSTSLPPSWRTTAR